MKFISFLIISLISLCLVKATPVQDPPCRMHCDLSYSPLCATDGEGKTMTFRNLCVMKSENCISSTNFQKTADGPCP